MTRADNIVDRLVNFFDRQIALYEEMLKTGDTLATDIEADDLNALAVQQETFSRRAKQLEEELGILSREWERAENVTDAERQHIGGLARHAEAMAKRLETVTNDAASKAQTRMRTVKDELDGLRRGQQSLTKYRSGNDDSGYLDTKA